MNDTGFSRMATESKLLRSPKVFHLLFPFLAAMTANHNLCPLRKFNSRNKLHASSSNNSASNINSVRNSKNI